MIFKLFIVLFSIFFIHFENAKAACFFGKPIPQQDFEILQTWPIEHFNDPDVTGCLTRVQGENDVYLVYTPYAFICEGKIQGKIQLSISYSCCDTGRAGDYACGVIPVPKSNDQYVDKDTQTPLTAVPANNFYAEYMIPELINKLKKGSLYGAGGAADRLISFQNDEKHFALVKAYESDLRNILSKETKSGNSLEIARVLKVINPDDIDAGIHELFLTWLSFYEIDRAEALDYFQTNPDEITLSVLKRLIFELLQTASKTEREHIFVIFQNTHSELIKPQLGHIYTKLRGRIKDGYDITKQEMDFDIQQWKMLVCHVYQLPQDMDYQKIIFDTPYLDLPNVECFQ